MTLGVSNAASAVMKRIGVASPRPRARLTGIVYLLYFLTAVLAALLLGRRLVVYSEVANVIATACYIAVTLLLYDMFKPVNKNLSFITALFSLVGCMVQTLRLFHFAPAHVSPLFFFGPYCILIGYLIYQSTFLPRFLGALMAFAGVGWLLFEVPALANHLSSSIESLGILAEASLMLWLLIKGVDAANWAQKSNRLVS